MASSSDDRMNEPPTSLGLVPHQVSNELLSDACICYFKNLLYYYVNALLNRRASQTKSACCVLFIVGMLSSSS